jgi:hydrogenase-4 component F
LGHEYIGNLLVGFGLGSVLIAAPFVLVQRNLRRLLAYSSIDHAGLMVAALGFGGRLGALGAVLHMLFHAVTKPLAFFCAGNVQQRFGTVFLRKITGVMRVLPWTGGLLLMVVLATTGVPPFSMFQSEFQILCAGGRRGDDLCGVPGACFQVMPWPAQAGGNPHRRMPMETQRDGALGRGDRCARLLAARAALPARD